MEDGPGASTVARNGGGHFPQVSSTSSSSSFQSSRKEWRVVSDPPLMNSSNERGREPLDLDFCSLSIDDVTDNGMLQQKLRNVSKQREELQRVEIELHAQVLVRSEIARFQKAVDSQAKEHTNAMKKLQEQFNEKESRILELEKALDEKERELHAIRMDNEAHAWAKDDLLREQSEELQSFRMVRDSTEAERVKHIKQIHDLQEHIQEKERQFMELQEQCRVAQESIIYKEDQIRDAQTWLGRAQEMEALQTTANQTLQAELQKRTEQYNQLWIGFQRQFGDMERLHLHIQQLQHELADARGKNSSLADGSHPSSMNSSDVSRVGDASSNHPETNDINASILLNGSLQNSSSEGVVVNTSQIEGADGLAYSSSLYGMPTYYPSALHPFLMHQQAVAHPPHVTQTHFVSLQGISSGQNWANQQANSNGENILLPNQSDSNYGHGEPINRQGSSGNMLNSEAGQGLEVDSAISSSIIKEQVHDFVDASNGTVSPSVNSEELTHDALSLNALAVGAERKEKQIGLTNDHELDKKAAALEQSNVSNHEVPSELPSDMKITCEASPNTGVSASFPGGSDGYKTNTIEKFMESYLMDEGALLACIARSIGSGSRIKISSTLPNRLGKMLAPLDWHDYRVKYGKLDDFLASHPELFLVEGDSIQLRDGAQKIIAAMAVAAKIAAVSAAPPPSRSSSFPHVALTPMAQTQGSKRALSNSSHSPFPTRASAAKTSNRSSDSSSEVNSVQSEPSRSVDRIHILQGDTVLVERSARKQSGRSVSAAPPVARR